MNSPEHPVLVVGAGFAGVQAALGARRAGAGRLAVTLLSPEPVLEMRPRLYEADPASMAFDLRPTLDAAGVRFVAGRAEALELGASRLLTADGVRLPFGRLVIATGSRMAPPAIAGLEHACSIDTVADALQFERALRRVAALPDPVVVVVGAGFAGIELALELRPRVRAIAGPLAAQRLRIELVDRADRPGAALGPRVQPVVEAALAAGRIGLRLGARLRAVEAGRVVLEDGSALRSDLSVICTGLRPAAFTDGLALAHAPDGRLVVDEYLRLPEAPAVFAAGDAARAEAAPGRWTLLSCQHARGTGTVAGENAARDLLGLPLQRYAQPDYVTCLDLGDAGAVLTEGWEREPRLVGAEAKHVKRRINTQLIYPPRGRPEEVLAAAVDAAP